MAVLPLTGRRRRLRHGPGRFAGADRFVDQHGQLGVGDLQQPATASGSMPRAWAIRTGVAPTSRRRPNRSSIVQGRATLRAVAANGKTLWSETGATFGAVDAGPGQGPDTLASPCTTATAPPSSASPRRR